MDRSNAKFLTDILLSDKETLKIIYKKFSSMSFFHQENSLTNICLLLIYDLLESNSIIISIWILYNDFKRKTININPYIEIFNFLSHSKVKIISQMALYVINNKSLDILSNSSAAEINSPNFSLTYVFQIDQNIKTNFQISPILSVSNENPNENDLVSMHDALIKITTGPYINSLPLIGPFNEPPELYPIQNEELNDYKMDYVNIPFIFDDNEKTMIYEPVESIISRISIEHLHRREVDIIYKAIQNDLSLVSFLWHDIKRCEQMISINMRASRAIYKYVSEKDQSIFDTFLLLNLNSDTTDLCAYIILQGNFPYHFVETYSHLNIERIHNTKEKYEFEKYVKCFCEMMIDLFSNNIIFSDILITELSDFCEEKNINSFQEAQDLISLIENQ